MADLRATLIVGEREMELPVFRDSVLHGDTAKPQRCKYPTASSFYGCVSSNIIMALLQIFLLNP